jgi:hypothetical protein
MSTFAAALMSSGSGIAQYRVCLPVSYASHGAAVSRLPEMADLFPTRSRWQ